MSAAAEHPLTSCRLMCFFMWIPSEIKTMPTRTPNRPPSYTWHISLLVMQTRRGNCSSNVLGKAIAIQQAHPFHPGVDCKVVCRKPLPILSVNVKRTYIPKSSRSLSRPTPITPMDKIGNRLLASFLVYHLVMVYNKPGMEPASQHLQQNIVGVNHDGSRSRFD